MYTKKYDNIISLGFFCSTALELERIGLRSNSNPFDWILSYDISKVIYLINNKFEDFLNIKYLKQYRSNPNFYVNTKYDIHFYHDFDKYKTLEEQIEDIDNKYRRRINKFYEVIKSKTLFVRYISSKEECIYIEENLHKILKVLRSFNQENDIIFVANEDIKSDKLEIFNVEVDNEDTVARKFIEKNIKLEKYLTSNIYDYKKRVENLNVYSRKQKRKKLLKIPNKCINLIKKNILKIKIHSNIYER